MPDYTITRTGKPPLAFSGEILAAETTRQERGYLFQRWHDLTLYQTAGGKLVLHVEYHCERKRNGEAGHSQAGPVGDASALPAALERYDPLEHVGGYPAGAQFVERQKKLLAAVQSAYYEAVGRLLAVCGVPERVE